MPQQWCIPVGILPDMPLGIAPVVRAAAWTPLSTTGPGISLTFGPSSVGWTVHRSGSVTGMLRRGTGLDFRKIWCLTLLWFPFLQHVISGFCWDLHVLMKYSNSFFKRMPSKQKNQSMHYACEDTSSQFLYNCLDQILTGCGCEVVPLISSQSVIAWRSQPVKTHHSISQGPSRGSLVVWVNQYWR